MKRLVYIIFLYCFFSMHVCADVYVYSEHNNFGLKDSTGKVISEPVYKKLIRLGKTAWIMQDGTKFGVIHDSGKIIVKPKYNQAERVLGKFVKLRKGDKYGIFDEMGFEILPVEYSSIDLLYGGMFVTSKHYRYGITDLNGQIILDNIFDDIYMPDFNTLILVNNGEIFEIKKIQGEELNVPLDVKTIKDNAKSVDIEDIASSPIASTGYYGITATDFILKLFSSLSPSYEQTIDELMFSHGADTVSVLVKCTWLPKFPFVYAKKYYNNVADPYKGPLSQIKKTIRKKIKK